jgi:hypothetical protein
VEFLTEVRLLSTDYIIFIILYYIKYANYTSIITSNILLPHLHPHLQGDLGGNYTLTVVSHMGGALVSDTTISLALGDSASTAADIATALGGLESVFEVRVYTPIMPINYADYASYQLQLSSYII